MTRLIKHSQSALQVPYTAKDSLHLLIKQGVEAILNEEIKEHLDYERYEQKGRSPANSRNGTLKKKVQTSLGTIAISVPRDRKGTFKPRIVQAYAKDITDKDHSLIALYEEGLPQSTLETSSKELYKNLQREPSPLLIKRIGALFKQWQQKSYDHLYLSLSCDPIVYSITREGSALLKKGYVCSGTNSSGRTDPLGLWTISADDECFWKTLFTSLKRRGISDILVVYHNGLPAFQELLAAIFPRTQFQQHVITLIHEALPYIPKKLHSLFLVSVRALYNALGQAEARFAFKQLQLSWGPKAAFDTSHWVKQWEQRGPFFSAGHSAHATR